MALQDHDLYDDVAQILIDEETLQGRIAELAREIERDYADRENLIMLCVLKGAYLFLADLSRHVKLPHEVDFMAVSSYGDDISSSGAVRIVLDLYRNIGGQHVLIVEDIIDSGRTLDYMRRSLLAREPASLHICALLNKPERREIDVPVDYLGFNIPDEFVVGYGLDFAQLYRNLPYIAVLKPRVFAHLMGAPEDE